MFRMHRAIVTYSSRRPILHLLRQPVQSDVRHYSASLQPADYHRLADDTMDKLTAELEDLLEENDVSGSDVEYSV
jgi:Frataxin-like domain